MEYLIGKDGNSLKKLTQLKNIKLIIQAGQAKPTPPVGPALGQYGVNLMDFCKQFNDLTKSFKTTIPVNTQIRINPDKTFRIVLKAPSNTYFLKIAANSLNQSIQNKSFTGNISDVVSGRTVTLKQVYEIAIIRLCFILSLPQQSIRTGTTNWALLSFISSLDKSINLDAGLTSKNYSLLVDSFYKISKTGQSSPIFPDISGVLLNICKNILGSAQSLKFKIISDL